MKYLIIAFIVFVGAPLVTIASHPHQPLHPLLQQAPTGLMPQPLSPVMPPCAADDPCPDPSRPWMRGHIEIQCTMPAKLDAAREAAPTKNIVPCGMCKHKCNPFDPNAELTDNRSWDPVCGARCSLKGCACPNPCDS